MISTPWILISQILPIVSTFIWPSMSFPWFTSPWFLLWSLTEDWWMCGVLWKQWLSYYMIWWSLLWIMNLVFDLKTFHWLSRTLFISVRFCVDPPVFNYGHFTIVLHDCWAESLGKIRNVVSRICIWVWRTTQLFFHSFLDNTFIWKIRYI